MNRSKLEIENEIANLASGPWFREARLVCELLLDVRERLDALADSTKQIITGSSEIHTGNILDKTIKNIAKPEEKNK